MVDSSAQGWGRGICLHVTGLLFFTHPVHRQLIAASGMTLFLAVGLLSRAEALTAASSVPRQPSEQNKSQALSQSDIDDVQQLLIQNTKVLTKLQEVLRRDNRDVAIMSDIQQNTGVALMTA